MPQKCCDLINRSRLTCILNDLRDNSVVYIYAPAGYGKTIAVRHWFDMDTRNKVFISLDEYDNTPVRFCKQFCDALCICRNENLMLNKILSHASFEKTPEETTFNIISALSEKSKSLIIIDDFHYINDENILRLFLSFLKRLPDNFQVVITSRNELPSVLYELWIKGKVTQITADDLRFNYDEIKQVYKKSGCVISTEQAEEIYRYTGGWAISINAFLLSDGEFSTQSMEYLNKFIQVNIWEKWDEKIRSFILNTSGVNELNPSLCSMLTDVADSAGYLKKLKRNGVFIYQIKNGSYHYNHLFKSFLKDILSEKSKEFKNVLLEKEGHWYLSQRDFRNAIECFIKCESYVNIAQCLRVRERIHFETLFTLSHSPIIQYAAEKYPYLYSLLSWIAFNEGQADMMTKYADKYYKYQNNTVQPAPDIPNNIIYVKMFDYRNSLSDVVCFANKLHLNPLNPEFEKTEISSLNFNQSMPFLHCGTRDFSECAVGDVENNVLALINALNGLFGEESRLLQECLTAGLLYEQGSLEEACKYAYSAGAEIKESFMPETKFFTMSLIVCIMDSLNHQEHADEILKTIADMIEKEKAIYLSYNFNALKTRRKLNEGDTEAADYWLKSQGHFLYSNLHFYKIYGYITTCRAYITKGSYDFAIILLKKVLTLSELYNRPLNIIEIKILLSISHWKKKRGFQKEAVQYMEEAVSIAYKFNFTQIFENEGAELYGIMHKLLGRTEQQIGSYKTPVSFVKKLYFRTLENRSGGLTSGQSEPPVKYTDKQKAVMKLLCEGKSYRQITDVLGIKLPTLRSHIALIYKKLDVANETDAIIKIKTLGVLDET